MKIRYPKTLVVFALTAISPALAQTKQVDKDHDSKAPRPATRLIWQDDSDHTVRWGDLTRDANGFAIKPQAVAGFPKLDADKQSLVQMEAVNGSWGMVGIMKSAFPEIAVWLASPIRAKDRFG